jgi:hypothetical protein
MLSRAQVFSLVNQERDYQDRTYNAIEKTSIGQTRAERDYDAAPGVLMLEAYVRKATDAWVNTKGSQLPTLQQVAKIAAIAVRILERAGGSEVLLESGLR